MNWGRAIGLLMSGMCILCAIGYAAAKDWRKAIYYLLVAGVNLVFVY